MTMIMIVLEYIVKYAIISLNVIIINFEKS